MCEHHGFAAEARVSRDETGKRFTVGVAINCTECGESFRFLGLPAGENKFGASCSEDAKVAILAIRPPLK